VTGPAAAEANIIRPGASPARAGGPGPQRLRLRLPA